MWSVAAPRNAQAKRDPAPSKWAYRYQRWMLTPLLRRLLLRWLPAAALCGGMALWLTTDANRARLSGMVVQIRDSIEGRPEFTVSAMAVVGASETLTQQVREVLPVDFPLSQFELDLEEMRERVAELPAVDTARLRIRTGGILEVAVDERLPVAVWRSPEGLHLIDAEGVVVAGAAARADRADLPLLVGLGADTEVAEARAILAAADPIAPRVRGLQRRGDRRWDLVLDRDQRILLPETGAVQAVERVVALNEVTRLLDRDLLAVDLRVPRRPTLRLAPDANETLKAARLAKPEDES